MTISEETFVTNPQEDAGSSKSAYETDVSVADHDKVAYEEMPRVVSKKGNTLRNRLLLAILPTVLIPLAVASTVGIRFTNNEAEDTFLSSLDESVFLASETAEDFIEDAFDTTELLAASPLANSALSSGTQKAQSMGLLNQPIEQIEQQFASTKLLTPNAQLNNYLQKVAEEKGVAEIILTERNGFNVGYNVPTSDFVQSDEEWWQIGKEQGEAILEPEFDESANAAVLELVSSIENPDTGELLAVTKVGLSLEELNEELAEFVEFALTETEQIQIIDAISGKALNTLSSEQEESEQEESEQGETLGEVIGGQTISEVATLLSDILPEENQNPEEFIPIFAQLEGVSNVSIRRADVDEGQLHFGLYFEYGDRAFQALTVTGTKLVAIASVERQEIAAAGRSLSITLGLTAIALAAAATVVVVILARQLSEPLSNLTDKAQLVADGDLSVRANPEGTAETIALADNFNNLVEQVNNLIREQKAIAQQQKEEKEALEMGIFQLLDDVSDAVDGDLTVRANLESMEMSTVADLFNAIIDNLNDIAVQVKHSSIQVGSSLAENYTSIQHLADEAIEEAEETRKALASVEEMSHSIQEVSQSANQAANLANEAYAVTQKGTTAINETANSILGLRTTVAETAMKMKQLEDSSKKISQIVSLIEEIALKTNVLAINAGRAGEHGQGFSIFGQQLAALAEQSVAATKEISQIVSAIQLETQEVAKAMEDGSTQAVGSTRLVEATKQQLEEVLQRSQSINELMQAISEATISQTGTSQVVTQLMQQIARQSEERLASSQQISESIQGTVKVAKSLESAVEQFKVSESDS